MTRINTNVSSLTAQKTLARSNLQLQEALTRLSTGLRINAGKDDPAGLIASEVLRSDIVSVEKGVSNSQRANQMIATADSALGQVSSLLNDIRGLISEAANTGAMSAQQIEANQLQVDSSLAAIDRIAQVTQFQGKRLLDGTLDFVTDGVSNTQITDMTINQANFGTNTQISVAAEVVAQAEKAELDYASNTVTDANGVVLEVGGTKGFEAFSFAYGSSVSSMADAINLVSDALGVTAEVEQVRATANGTGAAKLSSPGDNNDVQITALTAGNAGGNIAVKYVANASSATTDANYMVVSGNNPDTLIVNLGTVQWSQATGTVTGDTTGTVSLRARMPGAEYLGATVFVDTTAGSNTATYDAGNKVIHLSLAATTIDAVVAAIGNAAGSPVVNALFEVTGHVDGAGALANGAMGSSVNTAGVTGGTLTAACATAAIVIDRVGANGNAANNVTASNGDSTNTGAVSVFEEYAYYGTANIGRTSDTNDYLQFLGASGSRNMPVRFVKDGPSATLSVTGEALGDGWGYAWTVVQNSAANSSFKIQAKNAGTDWNNVTVALVNAGAGNGSYTTYNAQTKTLTIAADLAATPTASTLVDLVNNNPIVSKYFTASVWGAGTGTVVAADASATKATTRQGQQYSALVVHLATNAANQVTTTANDLVTYAASASNIFKDLGISITNASITGANGSNGAGVLAPTTSDVQWHTTGESMANLYATADTAAQGGANGVLRVRALNAGAGYDGVKVVFSNTGAGASPTFTYDAAAKTLTIGITSGTTTSANVITRFTAANAATAYSLFQITAVNGTGGANNVLWATDNATLSGGTSNLGSTNGVHLLGNYDVGEYIGSDGLNFYSSDYGSSEFVSVKALSGTFTVTDPDGTAAERDYGADVNVRINGIAAVGKGLQASITTSALDMSLTLSSTVEAGATINFDILSGGAQFQLGPEVVSNQQARLGLQSLSTAKLGGSDGRLYQLRSGGTYDLKTDPRQAAAIVEDVINQVTTLRGRLGAFQATTLETNINALQDTLESLTDAESSIRDADFAAESARLTRAQILVQSGTAVLAIANRNPEAVLALLR